MTRTTPELPPIGRVFKAENIPQELKAMRRWAPWKAVWNETREKYDKIPYHPNHYGLSTKDVSKWVDFESAARTLRLNPTKYAGLGFVLTDIKGVVGIDLDNCVSNGVPQPWAQEIVDSMASYSEVSPSGNGLRVLCSGTFDSDWNNHDVGIEVYSGHAPRFLTITGDTPTPLPMAEAPAEILSSLFTRYGKGRQQANVIPLTMPELIADIALPDVADLDIPESTRELLLHGPGEDVDDRSGALHAAGVQLYSAGYSDAMVLSILANSQPVMDIALSHRRHDEDRALAYLWVEHCQKAKPKAVTKDSILADFDDLSNDPEVVEQAKKAQAAAESKEDRFKLETAAEFMVRRKASWVIKDVLPNANVGVFYGASGSGKSFFAFEMMAAVARGIDWCGKKTTKSRVCWVAAEGQEDMRKRVQGYCQHHGITAAELSNMYFISNAPNFLEIEDVRAVVKQIKKQGDFDIVMVDTLAQVMPGGNENSGEDMGKVLGHCKEITRHTGAMVGLVHHSGKDESRGARGWSGLRAACDFEFEIIRADEDRLATITKMKGGADGGEFGFQLDTIVVGIDDDGDNETTCVIRFTDGSRQTIVAAQGPSGKIKKVIMDTANQLLDASTGPLTTSELSAAVVSRLPHNPVPGKRDLRKQHTKRDLDELVADRFLVVNPQGHVSLPV